MITRVFLASLVLVATSGLADCRNDEADGVDVIDGVHGTTEKPLREGEARSRKLRYQITAAEDRAMEVDKAEVNVHLVPMEVVKGLYGMPGIDPKDLRQARTATTSTISKNEATKDLSQGLKIRYTEIEFPKRKDLQALSSKRSPLLIRLLDESNSVEGSGPESVVESAAVVQQPRGFSTTVQEINDLQYQNQQQLYFQQSPQQQQPPQVYQQQQNHQQLVVEPQYQNLETQYQHQQGLEEQQNHVVEPQVKQVIVAGEHRTHEEAQPESEGHFSEVGDPNYQFSYAVRDADKGADYGHEESKAEGRTSGQYWLTLPDGRRQRVRYWADSKGFRASVHYSDP